MKIYKPKKSLTYIRLFLVLFMLLLLNNNTLTFAEVNKVYNNNLDKMVEISVIEKMQDDIHTQELLTPKDSFVGELTGYAGDCPKCTGILACHPRTNVLEKGMFFDDVQYGTIRIVASSSNYPCGTILRFTVGKLSSEPIIAVVMDRGVTAGVIDLLTENEDYARTNIGRVHNQTFEVLRFGW